MIFACVFALGLLFAVFASILWNEKKNIIESLCLGCIWFFAGHIFCSMGLFLLDLYSVFRNICLTAAWHGIVLAAVCGRLLHKKKPLRQWIECDFSLRPMILPILVCVAASPFVYTKNEFFGMGQDEGVYQTQVICFLNGDTKRQKVLEEYELMETPEEQEHYLYTMKSRLGGYDVGSAHYPETVYDRSKGRTSGIIHGIPTYSAILASWASVFGIAHMLDVETLFYFCVIFLVWCICRNLGLKKFTGTLACILTAAAPVIVWVSKSALTEIFLTVLMVWFLYRMTERQHQWLSILPVAAFACYHVSIYTMIPLFLMIYGGMYVFTRRRQYAVLLPVTVIGYLASFFMMRHVQPFYTMNNYKPFFNGTVTVFHIVPLVVGACAAVLAAVGVFLLLVRIISKKQTFSEEAFLKRAEHSRPFRMFLSALLLLPFLYCVYKCVSRSGTPGWLTHATIWNFFANAGILLVPAAIAAAAAVPRFFLQDKRRLVVFLMFFYCIPVYAAFMRPEIEYYYYYARYLAPFLPLAVIFSVLVLERSGKKVLLPLAACGLVLVLPYDRYLIRAKDDTRMEWSVLEDVMDCVDENTCVLLDKEYGSTLWLPIKAMSGAAVIPLDEDSETQAEKYSRMNGSVVCITSTPPEGEYRMLYQNVIHHTEDDLLHTGKIVLMSNMFQTFLDRIYVYEVEKYRFSYTVPDQYDRFSGLSAVEGDFSWTSSPRCTLDAQLYAGDFLLTITMGCPMPGTEEAPYPVDVTINGTKLGTFAVTPETNGGSFTLPVDAAMLRDGQNRIQVESALWSAADSNPEDTRMLGFPLKSLVFEPIR